MDERAESFQRNFNQQRIILSSKVANPADRVFANEFHIWKFLLVQGAWLFVALFYHGNGEAMGYGRWRRVGPITIIAVAGEIRQIEDFPITQMTVAEKIQLSGADAAN